MELLVTRLKRFQANSVVFYSTAHGFHWNVEGPLFTQYHAFFEQIYSDVYSTIDVISEWLRKFDSVAPYTLQDFISNNTYGDVQLDSNSPISMTRQLLDMNERMIQDIKEMFDIATNNKEQGLANFLADRQDKHEFWGWWLRSSLKPTIN
jgi:starvation-inducible DNA-binding protein